jgi:hypothetical protein
LHRQYAFEFRVAKAVLGGTDFGARCFVTSAAAPTARTPE